MYSAKYKECIDCGATFKRSRADYTVRCPDCRRGHKPVTDVCVVCEGKRYIVFRQADGTMVTDRCYRCNR